MNDRGGNSAIEFALLAPAMFMLLIGMMKVAIVFNNYIEVTNAVRAASRAFASSRTSATPYTLTSTAICASAPNLRPCPGVTGLSFTASTAPAGSTTFTACTTDGGCATALSNNQTGSAQVTASYPCSLTVMNVNFIPSCTLSSQTSEMIQ